MPRRLPASRRMSPTSPSKSHGYPLQPVLYARLLDEFTRGRIAARGSGDANYDGKVDINDLTIVLANYNTTGATWSTGDFNGDGRVNINDLTIVLANYNETLGGSDRPVCRPCPSPRPCCLPPPHWPAAWRMPHGDRSNSIGA